MTDNTSTSVTLFWLTVYINGEQPVIKFFLTEEEQRQAAESVSGSTFVDAKGTSTLEQAVAMFLRTPAGHCMDPRPLFPDLYPEEYEAKQQYIRKRDEMLARENARRQEQGLEPMIL